jgi:methionyl-tRNA formyltransferase
MRLIFMGTPDFAVASLDRLVQKDHQIDAVFTKIDKPKGRGHNLQSSPVKIYASEHGLRIFQPTSLKDEAIIDEIRKINPDVIVVVAYGKILPKEVLDIPKYGCINVHGSLLPKYRGAAPVQRAVMNGEKYTGITTMLLDAGMDTGDILMQKTVAIEDKETSGELFDKLKVIGADLLVETLEKLENNQLPHIHQDNAKATYASMITKEDSLIDWTKDADDIANIIRGLNPYPGARTYLNGKQLKIYKVDKNNIDGVPGKLISVNKSLIVCCGKNSLILQEVQPENGKKMKGTDFLLGHKINDQSMLKGNN